MKQKLEIIENIWETLSQEVIDFMITNRIREYGENTKDFKNNEKASIFFFLKEGKSIKAFGMLKPITLYGSKQQYKIMGIWNIMAVEKGKWYGTILMNYIKNYLEKNKYTGIGISDSHNFEFYKKCWFTFIFSLLEKFSCISMSKKVREKKLSTKIDEETRAMFLFGKLNEFKEFIRNEEKIQIKIPFW